MSNTTLPVRPRRGFDPVGEGYRYILLTVITVAVLFTSTDRKSVV